MGESAMTTADDAFDRLMNRNALGIPVANPSAAGPVEAAGNRTAASVPQAYPRGEGGSVRVTEIMDDVGDYHPRGYDDEGGDVFATPTETDLEAVSEVEEAHRHGARILGRDADSDEYQDDDESGDGTEVEYRDVDILDGEVAPPGLALDRARRLRRFAYLPLAGVESFETRARDIMASMVSQNPDRPSLAIAGPQPGDGQTEICIRLALAAAKRVDYRVALVDFDVRKPQVAQRLGLSSKYFTIADVLRGSCPLGEALMYSEEDNLYVLPARASDRDGDEVLNDSQVRQVMEQLHDTFDFVIVCCGALEHADAIILCRHSGATALAGYCRHTRAGTLREAADRLAESGVAVAGLLLTGAM